jgi:predicted acyl esterase
MDVSSLVDQRLVFARRGRQLVYHSAPFDRNTEISGFFKLSAWLSIDQPDTDFQVTVYEIRDDGSSLQLTSQYLRARYREGLRTPALVATRAPLRYDFDQFAFTSQEVMQGSRLRLVIAPIDSIYLEKNYNSGGVVAEETLSDARPVSVALYHDPRHPSTLFVPIGAGSDPSAAAQTRSPTR